MAQIPGKEKKLKVRRGLKRTGKTLLPDKLTWLKQPTVVTMMRCDFNASHYRVLIGIIEHIQEAIDKSINKEDWRQLNMFHELENNKDYYRLTIPLRNLGFSPDKYKLLKDTLSELATIPVQMDVVDGDKEYWSVSGLFEARIEKIKKGSTETYKAYVRDVEIIIKKDIAERLVNVDRGFTKFVKEIAISSSSKYTIKFYLLISSWKDKGGFVIKYSRLREWLNIEDKYPEYPDFYKRIVRPAYEELFEKSDCWFEMAEEYLAGEKNPYLLRFKIIKAPMTEDEKKHMKRLIENFRSMWSFYLQMSDGSIDELLPFVSLSNYLLIIEKTTEIKEAIAQHADSIGNISAYSYASLKNYIESITGFAGTEI